MDSFLQYFYSLIIETTDIAEQGEGEDAASSLQQHAYFYLHKWWFFGVTLIIETPVMMR